VQHDVYPQYDWLANSQAVHQIWTRRRPIYGAFTQLGMARALSLTAWSAATRQKSNTDYLPVVFTLHATLRCATVEVEHGQKRQIVSRGEKRLFVLS
jgi:hypothetical protein